MTVLLVEPDDRVRDIAAAYLPRQRYAAVRADLAGNRPAGGTDRHAAAGVPTGNKRSGPASDGRWTPDKPAQARRLPLHVHRPGGADRVRLGSRSGFRFDTAPWIADERRMGVQLGALTKRCGFNVRPVALDDPNLDEGWWTPEWHFPTILRRWTDGDAVLPLPVPDNAADFVLLDVELGAPMAYRLPEGDRFTGFDSAMDLKPTPRGQTPAPLARRKQFRRAG